MPTSRTPAARDMQSRRGRRVSSAILLTTSATFQTSRLSSAATASGDTTSSSASLTKRTGGIGLHGRSQRMDRNRRNLCFGSIDGRHAGARRSALEHSRRQSESHLLCDCQDGIRDKRQHVLLLSINEQAGNSCVFFNDITQGDIDVNYAASTAPSIRPIAIFRRAANGATGTQAILQADAEESRIGLHQRSDLPASRVPSNKSK